MSSKQKAESRPGSAGEGEQLREHLQEGKLRIGSRDSAAMAAMATMPGAAGESVRRMASVERERQDGLARAIAQVRAFQAKLWNAEWIKPYVDSFCAWLAAECYFEEWSLDQPLAGGAFISKPHKHYESWCQRTGKPALDNGRFYEVLRQALELAPGSGPLGRGLYGLGLRSGK